MTEHDASLEARIQVAYLQMLEAVTVPDRRTAFTVMAALIAQRSLDQVRRHGDGDRSGQ